MTTPWAVRPPGWLAESLRQDPIRFVDVGARGGWQPKWRSYGEHVLFVGVEPDSAECDRLRGAGRPNEIFVDKALYHTVGEVTLYHCDPPSRTSIYRPNVRDTDRFIGPSHAIRVTATEQIPVTTFDLAMEPLSLGAIDFVKLDTQGSELDILRGAERALAGPMVGLEVEVEFSPVYEDQPLFADVAAFLLQRSFEFVDFPSTYTNAWMRFGDRGVRGYPNLAAFVANWASLLGPGGGLRKGHRLIYGDAIFMREPAAWIAAVQREERPRAQGIRGVMTCIILGYHEHARHLAGALRDASILTGEEVDSIARFVSALEGTWRWAASNAARVVNRLANRLVHLRSGKR